MIPWPTTWSHWAHYDDALPSGPRDTSPFTRSDKSQSRYVQTQQTLSEIPVVHLYSHPVTCDVWYTQSIPTVSGSCTISWSKEMILDIQKSSSKRTTRSCAMLRIGSCPSYHSPNDVIPLSTTSNVHSQETMTICWSQRASQLEAH